MLPDQDILAPYALSFQSDVLTEIKQQEAANNVQPQYTQPDPNTAREQLNHLRDVLDYIDSVRADEFATQDQKQAICRRSNPIQLQPESIDLLISLSDNDWQTIRLESNRILELVMRSAIQESQLASVRSRISNQVSLSLTSDKQTAGGGPGLGIYHAQQPVQRRTHRGNAPGSPDCS